MKKATILICDDNIAIHASLSPYLSAADMQIISLYSGDKLLKVLEEETIDLIIMDIMLPRCFGTDLCREIRRVSDIPLVFLTAKSEEEDCILGLEMGADDYITKPFSPREVVARIFTILKRTTPGNRRMMHSIANLTMNQDALTISVGETSVDLTTKEFQVLELLGANPQRVLNRDYILNEVWGYGYYGDTRAVDTIVKRLRKKLTACGADCCIRSVYGVGYKLEATS